MGLHKAVLKLKIKEFTAYRSNVLMNFCFGCVPLFVYILLWKAVYGNDFSKIGGYSYTQIITYYVLIFLCSRLLNMRENTVKIAGVFLILCLYPSILFQRPGVGSAHKAL